MFAKTIDGYKGFGLDAKSVFDFIYNFLVLILIIEILGGIF